MSSDACVGTITSDAAEESTTEPLTDDRAYIFDGSSVVRVEHLTNTNEILV